MLSYMSDPMGVHGNGITALLRMNLSKRATVMEFYYPSGFAYDYAVVTQVLGMTHYGFGGNQYVISGLLLYQSLFDFLCSP
jgi:hypothetical protein